MTVTKMQNHINRWFFKWKERAVEKSDDEDIPVRYVYKAPVEVIARRLAQDGYDKDSLRTDFTKELARKVQLCRNMIAEGLDTDGANAELLPVLENSTLEDWLATLKKIATENLKATMFGEKRTSYSDQLLNYMLSGVDGFIFSDGPGMGEFGFPCSTESMYAVALIEVLPNEKFFVLDATDMVDSGWTEDFDDLIEFHSDNTHFFKNFKESLDSNKDLAKLAPDNPALIRLLYANVITLMEAYLSDTLKQQVLKRNAVLRRFVQSHDAFKNSKREPVSEVFNTYDKILKMTNDAIDEISFHNVVTVKTLYENVLSVNFPKDVAWLMKAVTNRHDIVHRNGRTLKNEVLNIDSADFDKLVAEVLALVKTIDEQVKDGLLDDID
jgi:ribosomal protein S18